jgi:hypothetical protein
MGVKVSMMEGLASLVIKVLTCSAQPLAFRSDELVSVLDTGGL